MTIRSQEGGWLRPPTRRGDGCCGRTPTVDYLTATARGTTYRAKAMGGAYCARKTLLPTRSFPLLEGGQSGELYYLGRRLLDCSPCGREAPACGPRVEVQSWSSSEPNTELIPSIFGAEIWAILIVWAICHLGSERISMVKSIARSWKIVEEKLYQECHRYVTTQVLLCLLLFSINSSQFCNSGSS